MWEKCFSGNPSVRTAAAESPPPTTLNAPLPARVAAVSLMMACATPRVPSAKGDSSNTPIGPFQNTVFAPPPVRHRTRAPSRDRRRAPRSTRLGCVGCDRPHLRVRGEPIGRDYVNRQNDLARFEQLPGIVDLVRFQQRLTDAVALRRQEGEAHPATDDERVHAGGKQRLDDGDLVRDLGAAEHDRVGPVGLLGQPGKDVGLRRDERPGVGGQPLRDVVDRRLLAVHHAEAVGDERAVLPPVSATSSSASTPRSASSLLVSRGSKRTFSNRTIL